MKKDKRGAKLPNNKFTYYRMKDLEFKSSDAKNFNNPTLHDIPQ